VPREHLYPPALLRWCSKHWHLVPAPLREAVLAAAGDEEALLATEEVARDECWGAVTKLWASWYRPGGELSHLTRVAADT
jgi:hypothetical protein